MLQGTGSDVGKSLLTAGLCRVFARRGLVVRPFKPQNMSNNAAVTADGGEIGRAQALQARAAGIAPVVEMNPVLLKPQTDIGAQLVVRGKVRGNVRAEDYPRWRQRLLPEVLESFHRLAADADLVLIEGAGSAAEVNLRAGDIANMGFAVAAGVPVVLIGDIDRGGVIASLVGTWELLTATERDRVKGYAVNKFRGDRRLFDAGLAVIGERTGLPCFGVVPWFDRAHRLPAEDAVAVERDRGSAAAAGIRVVVPRLSRIANFDDLDPLIAEPDVAVTFVAPGRALPGDADVVVLPGSKATVADLRFLRDQGWEVDIFAHVRRGGVVVGLCGGYQMLGRVVRDPDGIEGEPGEAPGLGLLDVETVLSGDKQLVEASGIELATGAEVRGYEMHVGVTTGPGLARPLLRLTERTDGCISADGRVLGCYLHGLFAADEFRSAFLARFRRGGGSDLRFETEVEGILDALAAHLETHLRIDALLAAAGQPSG
jgi:adenosylcobyric acid synthase